MQVQHSLMSLHVVNLHPGNEVATHSTLLLAEARVTGALTIIYVITAQDGLRTS